MNRRQYLHDKNVEKIKLMDTRLVKIGIHYSKKNNKPKKPFGGMLQD